MRVPTKATAKSLKRANSLLNRGSAEKRLEKKMGKELKTDNGPREDPGNQCAVILPD